MDRLSGDRDSWSADNYYAVPALEHLGQPDRAAALKKRFETFAVSEIDSRDNNYRASARYLLALVRKHDGQAAEARDLLRRALDAEPDYLPARLELRGDAPYE